MATITKPMALDESFNTTESTSRNQADVLAGIEQAIVRGFGQVANAVAYDNTDSGLTADNVQDAIDEVDDTVDGLVDDVTEISSNIKSTQTASGNPITLTDAAPMRAESVTVDFLPKQDLHGYDYPWVGGVGKNKLNTATTTTGGITFTEDANGYISASPNNADGRGWGYSNCQYIAELKAGTYNIDWWASTLSSSQYKAICVFDTSDNMLVYAENFGESGTSQFTLSQDAVIGVETKIFDSVIRIQIRESTEEQVYSLWENICPITGYDEVNVDDVGANQWDEEYQQGYWTSSGYFQTANNQLCTKNKVKVTPGATYYFKINHNTSLELVVCCYDENGDFIERRESAPYEGDGIEWSIPNDTYYIHVNFTEGYGATYNNDISINYPSTDHSYHPYHQPTSATIQFGQTVYGGKSNFTDGGTDDEWDRCDLGDLSYSILNNVFVGIMPANVKQYFDGICEGYKKTTKQYNELLDGEWTSQSGEGMVVWIKNSNYSDATAFKNAMAGIKLVYEKATPSTIATPPSPLKLLKGTNHLTTNGTTITLWYQPDNVIGDVKGEIEKCAVDAEFMQFTDGTDTFTDVNLSLDASLHTVSVVGSKIEQKRFICFEVMDKMGGVLQGILASCIAFTDGAKTPSGTAFRAYIESLQMYVNFRIYGSGGSYTLAYQSETSFSASAFYVRVRLMNNL